MESNIDEIINDFQNLDISNLQINNDNEINKYKETIKILIFKILRNTNKKYIHEKTYFGDNSPENIKHLTIAHNIGQKQMKEGNIAQIIIGNFIGWEDLKFDHISGLDCKKKDNSIIIEIKNNTCNYTSQKDLLDKLSLYKIKNPNTRCIWGIINPQPNCKKLKDIIIYNNVEIEKIQGDELFKLVFNYNNIDYSQEIIDYVKFIISQNK